MGGDDLEDIIEEKREKKKPVANITAASLGTKMAMGAGLNLTANKAETSQTKDGAGA